MWQRQHIIPAAGVFSGIGGAQRLWVERRLRRCAAAEHPAILVEQRANLPGVRDEAALEAGFGEQEGDRCSTQIGWIAKGFRLARQQRLADQPPFGAGNLLLEQRQRAIGRAHPRHRRLGALHQRRIEQRAFDRAAKAAFIGEQRLGVDEQPRPQRLGFGAGQGPVVKIGLQPLRNIGVVTRRAGGIAEHQIDLQRLIGCHRLVMGIGQRAFGGKDQPRQQIALQRIGIGTVAFAVDPLAIQAKARWRRRVAGGAIGQPRSQRIEQWHDLIEPRGGGNTVSRVDTRNAIGKAAGSSGGCILPALVIDKAPGQRAKPKRGEDADNGERNGAGGAVTLPAFHVRPGKASFGEDDILEQPVDEKRARTLRLRACCPAKAGGQVADQPIKGRALLNATGQIETAQPDVGGGIGAKDAIKQSNDTRSQVDQPRRQSQNRTASHGIAIGLQAIGHAIGERLHGFVIGIGEQRRIGAGGQRQRRTNWRATAFDAQVLEKFGEARNQIGLGEDDIDRQFDAQRLAEFGKPGAQRHDMAIERLSRNNGDFIKADRKDYAVQRLQWPGLAQRCQKPRPGARVAARIAVLAGIAAGGIDQHGFVGKPPVAIPGAANAFDGIGIADKVKPGFLDDRRLAGTGRPDDGIPGQII